MRIAILGSRGYPSTYGGFETLVRHLAPFLSQRGHAVTVYCREAKGIWRWRKDEVEGVARVFTPGLDTKAASTLTYGLTSSIDALHRRYDAVIILNVANGFYLPIIQLTGAKVLVNVDGLEWQRDKWNWLGRSIFRIGAKATARFADELIIDSRALDNVWRGLLHRSGTYIPYGGSLVPDRPTERVSALGLTPSEYYLVVARLTPENNVELILDAHAKVGDERPLVVVGSANYTNPITDRLSTANDREVLWLGHISDQELLTDLWAHCAVYLHGHSVGGTNPALLQALGAGSPTLALDTPFNREVLEDSEQLFPHDPEVLAEMMQMLAADHPRREALRLSGRRRVAEAYSWEEVCQRYLDVCRTLLEADTKAEHEAV